MGLTDSFPLRLTDYLSSRPLDQKNHLLTLEIQTCRAQISLTGSPQAT